MGDKGKGVANTFQTPARQKKFKKGKGREEEGS
jgi:hypothetical protein